MPAEFGKWNSVYQRFNRWCREGVWERLFHALADTPDWDLFGSGSVEPEIGGAAGRTKADDIELDDGAAPRKPACYAGAATFYP